MSTFSIASINMRRRNGAMHALLNTNETDDILLIQEPWFGPIGVGRDDFLRNGVDVLGGANNPKWNLLYPHFSNDKRAKVMTYGRKHDLDKVFKPNLLRTSARRDLCSHPSILISDISTRSFTWRIINFYNDVDDPSAINSLLSLDIDPSIPTLLAGDFNSYGTTWYDTFDGPAPTSIQRRSGAKIEAWALAQGLSLLSPPGIPTRKGENGQRDSVLDLVWVNQVAWEDGTFDSPVYSWEESLHSDHALIRICCSVPQKVPRVPTDKPCGFHTNASPNAWELWDKALRFALRPQTALASSKDIDDAVDNIYDAIFAACKAALRKKGDSPGRKAAWWTDECYALVRRIQTAPREDQPPLQKDLKRLIKKSKREWADEYISNAEVWEVAAWRHGRWSSAIPALKDNNGTLRYGHQEMADLLSERFFANPNIIPLRFPDDPPPRPPRPFTDFSTEEIERLLKDTKNSSAPGESGIGYLLLKKAWPRIDVLLTSIYTACLRLGYHPVRWKSATVVVIPKPNKSDYSSPKAHRPISLLETMSKLLEKAIAKRFQHDIVAHNLVPTIQFGGQAHSSCIDAGLTLLHDIQSAHAAGLKAGMVLFDVKGFFDFVNHGRMIGILDSLGFGPEIVEWAHAFLANRKIRLKFNTITSDERVQEVGVPQGSPLSPVLSILYTSGLLHKMKSWSNSSLGMYVDDGALFACANEWEEVLAILRERYSICEEWLSQSGLCIEPEKTEAIFFQKPWSRKHLEVPSRILLRELSHSTYYVVRPTENIRYLGFFFNKRLKWDNHVTIMCNRARASACAMKLLGNTVRGLSMANWRLVLNAVCLPVLSYGSPLWFVPGKTKGLVAKTQAVQNEMVRMVAGAFRTAPREALCHLTRMLPMEIYLEKLTFTSALRLYRLPGASQLLRRLGPDWHVPSPEDLPLAVPTNHRRQGSRTQRPTALEALASQVPTIGPRIDVTVIAPWEVPNWRAQTSYMGVCAPKKRLTWVQSLIELGDGLNNAYVFTAGAVHGRRWEEGGDSMLVGGASLVPAYKEDDPPSSKYKWAVGEGVLQFDVDVEALAKAGELLNVWFPAECFPPLIIYIFSSNTSALRIITNPRTKSHQDAAIRFHKALTLFTLSHRHVRVVLTWSPKNDDLHFDLRARTLTAEAALSFPSSGLKLINSAAHQKSLARTKAFRSWDRHYQRTLCLEQFNANNGIPRRFAYTHTLVDGPSVHNHPLWREATKATKHMGHKKPIYHRRQTSTAFQLAVNHAFTGSYAKRFRPSDPPETHACECGHHLRDPDHFIRHCPLLSQQRRDTRIQTNFDTFSLRDVFNRHPDRLFTFLKHPSYIYAPPLSSPHPELALEEEVEGIG